MIAVTHLIVSLLLIELLYLDRNDAFVALLFGVFIDLDHLLGLKDYARANGLKAVFDLDGIVDPGGHWKSLLHSPVAAAVVAPISIASRLAIPLIFWAAHVLMDVVQEQMLGVFSAQEAVFLVLASGALATIRYSRCIATGTATTLPQYVRHEFRTASCSLRPSSRGRFSGCGRAESSQHVQ